MIKIHPIDRAYERCRILANIVEDARTRAEHNPDHEVWKRVGIVEQGDSRTEAIKKLQCEFDTLSALIDHFSILDMAAAMEKEARQKVEHAIGILKSGAGRALRQGDKPKYYRRRIIKDSENLRGLGAIAYLLEETIGEELMRAFRALIEARNLYAHGTDVHNRPKIDKDDVRQTLKQITDVL